MQLTDEGKEELAIALLLWRDYKCHGSFDVQIIKQAIMFAKMLDIEKQYNKVMAILPPMKITVR